MTLPDAAWKFVIYHHGLNFDDFYYPHLRERFYNSFYNSVYAPFVNYGAVACCII